jgi:hypothetical protein
MIVRILTDRHHSSTKQVGSFGKDSDLSSVTCPILFSIGSPTSSQVHGVLSLRPNGRKYFKLSCCLLSRYLKLLFTNHPVIRRCVS